MQLEDFREDDKYDFKVLDEGCRTEPKVHHRQAVQPIWCENHFRYERQEQNYRETNPGQLE